MRIALFLLGLSACGRIDFDPSGACTDMFEPNGTLASATPVTLGSTVEGVLCPGDVDVYAVVLTGGDELQADLTTAGPGWPTVAIASDTEVRGLPSLGGTVSAFANRDGTYYVSVAGTAATAGTSYRLTVGLREGNHVFVAPSGNDSNPGTFVQPWHNVGVSLGRLRPGDVLVLEDGAYTETTTGTINANCPATTMNGTQAQPIRVAALSERRAQISGSGDGPPVALVGCAWWTVEGLYLDNEDRLAGNSGGGVSIYSGSSHIVLRRLLVHYDNRYFNSHMIDIFQSSDVLVEETEVYDFHRAGVIAWESSNITFRRNYAASRGRSDIAGGFVSDVPATGDYGIVIGKSTTAVAENNVEEGNGGPFVMAADTFDSRNVHLFGNAALASVFGFTSTFASSGGTALNVDTHVVDEAVIGSGGNGLFFRSNQQASCERCTVIGSLASGWVADALASNPRTSSATCTDCLSARNQDQGFVVINQDGGWSIDHANTFGNGTSISPASAPEIVALSQIDPQLGGCLVYAPAGSPMHGAGVTGGDIGAQILYRYQDGALTGVPLWDPATGVFPCGAVVSGVNDDPATSCIGVHERLHVGTSDCPLPLTVP